MRFTLLFFALVTSLVFVSCDKENNEILFYWDETGCADPWAITSEVDQDRTETLKDYLEEQGIRVLEVQVQFMESIQEDCFACSCKTGNRFIIRIVAADTDKILALGFKKV